MNPPTDILSHADAPASFRDDTLDRVERIIDKADCEPELAAQDEPFWHAIRDGFGLNPDFVNLNNGGCSPSPRVVADSLKRQIDFANQGPSIFMWRKLDPEIEGVRRRLAALFGADPEEIAITRNASESLMTCLFGLPMEAGDEILTTSQDYPRMINAIRQLERREAIKMVQIDAPTAPSDLTSYVEAFEKGINSRTKIILVSHVGFMNGQINPVAEICDLGRRHGIPVVVDGAHAFAHFRFTRDDIGCDYFGTSLHKWLMAPVGTGMLYVRRPLIKDLWALMAPGPTQDEDIRKYEEIGTHQAAVHNAIGEALTFHEMIGTDRKSARLRYLRSRWTGKVLGIPNLKFHTNLEPGRSCAICTVSIDGVKGGELSGWLENRHGIIVSPMECRDFSAIRVSPQVYTTVEEVDRFGAALANAALKGLD